MLQRRLALLPSSHHLVSDRESDVTPRAMFACFARGEEQTNEPESQKPTQISPHCVSLSLLLKSHLEIGAETKLLLVPVFGEQRGCTRLPLFQQKRWPQPLGKRYNEDLYAYTLTHFNWKRYTHPALWTSDGCIMGHDQNMTVHHNVLLYFSLLFFAGHLLTRLFFCCCFGYSGSRKFETM